MKRPCIRAAACRLACALAPAALLACAAEPAAQDEKVSTTIAELEVASYASGSSCSTTVVRGLTEQLVAEINCMHPDTLRPIASIPSVDLTTAAGAAPYLTSDAANALRRAAGRGRGTIRVTSALRTLPQQYLLYRWKQRGRCGIRAAARPGTSNHESALAIDVSNYSSWRSLLESEGFGWLGSRDPVHFDYRGGSIGNLSIRAFQRLWNRNHPSDRIPEDGVYGAQTESRLARSPGEGFPIGACGSGSGPGSGGGDAGVPGAELGCERGMACSDCNAIARNCGFCASTGACMAGDGDGPWTGSCGDWQWITPSHCPAPPPDDPPPPDEPPPDEPEEPPPAPMCEEARGACASGADCCGALSCRRGASYPTRCCVESGNACASGGDCCGYMDCVSGRCACRSTGRACLEAGDCCSGSCVSGTCR